ncbi:hypothetical protein SK224_00210 [Microbacterium sp. BG28]|uniref:hypothetical protein n=1 Tax=Microbacterium sp. BG28 TaxID=3097356 RepID=UPI002A5A9928|nr:hypothetical protein [Microbacterium sp. BG28]MDY0827542.1 hypothetical protein [Microbacterium sp. BG28]
MARNPIEIPVGIDSGPFRKGVESGIIAPLENAEKALEELGRSRGPEQLERDLKDAQRQTEKLKDETRQTARAIEENYKDAYREAKQAAGDGLGGVKAATQEVTQEVGQNLGEAVSSIRGDFSDLGQVGQDTLGGLAATVSSMGPAGLVGAFALAAGAVGLGALTAGMEEAKEKQEAVNEAAAQFAQGYIEGINGALSAASVFGEINAIATDPERYQAAKDAAVEWGVDVSVAMGAMAGDANALAIAQQGLADRSAAATKQLAEQETQVDQNAGAAYDLADSVKSGTERMDALTQALELAKTQADDAASAWYNYTTRVGTATEKTDLLGNTIWKLPDGKEVVVDAETQRAYEDLNALDSKRLADKEVAVRAVVDTSSWDNWKPGDKVGGVKTAIRPGSGGGIPWF